MGAVLLRRPAKLAKLVHGMVLASPLPVTVKIRTGESEKKVNATQVVRQLMDAGAAAVSVHGRTMEQRWAAWAGQQVISREHVGVCGLDFWFVCHEAGCLYPLPLQQA